MGLEKVINEINNEAKEKATAIINEGKKEAAEILRKEKERLAEERQNKEAETAKAVKDLLNQGTASLKLWQKKEELNAKKEVLEEIFQKTREKISKSREKEKLLKKLINKAEKELDAKYFYSNKEDKAMIERIAPKLKFRSSIDCLGGVVLENEASTIRVNYSFEVFLKKAVEENLSELNKRLFAE